MEKRFYTIKDVSGITGYSERHLRYLTREGKIKSVKPNGGQILIKKGDLENFLGDNNG